MSDRTPPPDHLPDEPQDPDVPPREDPAPRPGGPDLSEFARLDAEEPAPPQPEGPSLADFMSPTPGELDSSDEADQGPHDPQPAVASGPDLSEFMRLEEDDAGQTTEDSGQDPVVEEPVVEEPVVEEPVAEEPVAEEPVADEPVADEPVADEPVVQEPVAENSVPVGPDLAEFIAEEPAIEEPEVEEPDAAQSAWPAPEVEEPHAGAQEAWPSLEGEDDHLAGDPFADAAEPAVEHGLAGDPVGASADDEADYDDLDETGLVGAGFTPTDPVRPPAGDREKVSLLKRPLSLPSLSLPSLSLPSLSLPGRSSSRSSGSSGRASRSRSSLALPASVNPRLIVLLVVAVVGVAGYMITRGGASNDTGATDPVPSPSHATAPPTAKAPKKAAAKPASGAHKPAQAVSAPGAKAPAAKAPAPAPAAGWTRVNVTGGGYSVDVPPGYQQLVTGPLVTFSTANRTRAYAVNGARSDSGSAREAAQRLVHSYRSRYSIIELFTHVNGSRVDISARGRRHGTAFNQRILASVVRAPSSKHGLMVIQSFSTDRPRGQDRVGLREFAKVRGTLRPAS